MASKDKVLVLDLDHTILHMLKKSEMPSTEAGFAEDVAYFTHAGIDYAVALRIGTTSLVRAMKSNGVCVVVATCNLVADKVMAALAARCDVFADIELHIIESREKGAKSLVGIGLEPRTNSQVRARRLSRPSRRAQVVIIDDSISAWDPVDQSAVVEAKRFDVTELQVIAEQDEDALDDELGYLLSTKDDLLAIFCTPSVNWTNWTAVSPGGAQKQSDRPEAAAPVPAESLVPAAASLQHAEVNQQPLLAEARKRPAAGSSGSVENLGRPLKRRAEDPVRPALAALAAPVPT